MTDIVGSTEHVAELGDRGWRDLVQLHHGIIRDALRRHVGREVDTAGDGFFAVFDAPAAALACALDVCGDVRELGIEVRAGLHVGEVEQIAGKVGGITVPIAARIMATAGPSEVVVSGTVRDLAAGAGFRFEDLGLRELKGVPGEWRIFRVARAADDEKAATVVRASQRGDARPTRRRRVIGPGREARMVGPEPIVDPASRRAAAVRRVRSRPVWVRHRWLTAAGTVVFAGAIAGAGLLAWSPWRAPALTGVSEDSVGIVDAGRNEVVHQIEVGARPAGIAHGEGSVWVSNSGSDNVSRIDPTTRSVIDTIDVGEAPSGIAVAGGSVWVSNSGSRSVSRINAATGRVVDTIAVGNLPGAIAHGGGAIWVANTGDGTVTRIDPTSGAPGDPIAVGLAPSAIAADEAGVWVASRESAVVTRLDPRTGVASAAPIGVGSRPVALAIAGGSVWIANAGDDSVTRADIATDRVTATADVGGSPLSVAAGPAAIWVAVQEGAIHRIDPDDPNAPALRIPVGAAPQAVTLVEGAPWFLTHAAAGSHRGGTLRVVAGAGYSIDPAHFPVPELRSLFGDGLVGYRREGGIGGSTLMPDLATAVPRPTEGGRVYTFTLRSGLVYADGTPVRPDDFRRAIERAIQVEDGDFGARGSYLFATIEGAAACIDGTVSPCDLSAGIVTDTV
ncbi:MAG: hypothetical protein H0U10_02785, partial [Chloroflexia bacterium]|nr:hypothetical protein [Chloroflexia bacterium]